MLEALGLAAAPNAQPATLLPVADQKPRSSAVAAQKGLDLIQRTSATFFREGGCFACHAQNLTGMAITAAREHGFKVDETVATELARGVRLGSSAFEQPLLQRMDAPAGPDILDFTLLQMAATTPEPDHATDAMVHNIAAQQRDTGNWHFGGMARAPMEDGDFFRTAAYDSGAAGVWSGWP